MEQKGTWSMGCKEFVRTLLTSAQFLLKQSRKKNIPGLLEKTNTKYN